MGPARLIPLVFLTLLGAGPATQPARNQALKTAITLLTKEIQTGLQDSSYKIRDTCSYFQDTPATDITPAILMAELARQQVSSADPRITAYVNWQLLGALNGQVPSELAPQAVQVYLSAPRPSPNPAATTNRKLRDRAAQLARSATEEDEQLVNAELNQARIFWEADNEIILQYRAAIAARIPDSAPKFAAILEDARTQLQAGIDLTQFSGEFTTDVLNWAQSTPTPAPAELRELSAIIMRSHYEKGPELLVLARFDRNKIKWEKHTNSLDYADRLENLANSLEQLAQGRSLDMDEVQHPRKRK